MKSIFVLLAVFLTGCASLNSRVYENIRISDSKERVLEKLGQPDGFEAKSETKEEFLGYRSGADACVIALKEDKVSNYACQKDPNYRNAAQRFAKGFSDGMNASRAQQPVSCTTNSYAGTAYTNCY